MKKIMLAAVALLFAVAGYAANPPEVTENVLNAFKQTFYDPKEIKWYENDYGYEVHFKCDNVQSKVWYDKEGNIITTNRYYGEQNLHPFILGKIKKKYADKKVFGITEITNDSGLNYYVTLEDEKSWLTLKADALGHLEVYEKLKKL
jgi:hypothetical protein